MSPKGCLLPPEGRRAGGSRPEGGNRQPEGDIMWPAAANFPVSHGLGCRIVTISYSRADIAKVLILAQQGGEFFNSPPLLLHDQGGIFFNSPP